MYKNRISYNIITIVLVCVLFLILGVNTFCFSQHLEHNLLTSLTPHDSITIKSDIDFYLFPGDGSVENPYLIENYNITTSDSNGIYISSTSAYFIIRNCYIKSEVNGIYIYNVFEGTTWITNNTCNSNRIGILLEYSPFSKIYNNYCKYNSVGIKITYSDNCLIYSNNCFNNTWGIYISNSLDSMISLNTCSNNSKKGIYIYYSSNLNLTSNICSKNKAGIEVINSNFLKISGNFCNLNDQNGILLYVTDYCNISYNILKYNTEYGVNLDYFSDFCEIHHNAFVGYCPIDSSLANDDGNNNTWYDEITNEGNYWSDWSGFGDYYIDGFAKAVDIYPMNIDEMPTTVTTVTIEDYITVTAIASKINYFFVINLLSFLFIVLFSAYFKRRK